MIGGAIGSLFKRDEKEQQKQTAALQRIDPSTRETATLLELQRQLTDAARGVVNVPSRFALPQYAPAGGVTVNVSQTNNITAPDGQAVVATMRREMGPMLREEFRSLGISR